MKGTKYVNMGQQIHLLCNATGITRAPESIDWFFKGSRIHPSNPMWKGRVEILKHTSIAGRYFISELFIEQSTIADQGDYVCRSSDLIVNNMKVHVLNGKYDLKYILCLHQVTVVLTHTFKHCLSVPHCFSFVCHGFATLCFGHFLCANFLNPV